MVIESKWIKVSDRLPEKFGGIYKVKRENGDEVLSYWSRDKNARMMWRLYTNLKPTHWISVDDLKPLYDVVEWYE